jgi:hypothetical protein
MERGGGGEKRLGATTADDGVGCERKDPKPLVREWSMGVGKDVF